MTKNFMKITNPVGKKGEDAAAAFLQKKGYKILQRNFHIKGGEIDIVAEKDNTLVFIEVKTRRMQFSYVIMGSGIK